MATSPSFNWPEPDNTDLVKNGALAIRTAVDAIDTSMTDLLGGTTGQVLAKASATDMDFSWTTPSTAAGYSDNAILNSAFNVWQRGTSGTALGASGGVGYNADRWQNYSVGGTLTISRQSTNDTTNLPFIQYCARVKRDTGQTATGVIAIAQTIETINSIAYAGKQITLSFYARAGANYSSASNGLTAIVQTGTGTDQNVIGGFTGVASAISQTATLTTTWQRFTYTGTVATTATQIGVLFQYTSTGTAGANDFFEVTGVQLEVGSTATAYHPNQPTYEAELAACQRYYYRNVSGSTNFSWFAWGIGQGSSQALFSIPCPVTMRTTPTVVEFANLGLAQTGGINAITTLVHANSSPSAAFLQSNGTNTADAFYRLMANNSSSAYVGIGAEL